MLYCVVEEYQVHFVAVREIVVSKLILEDLEKPGLFLDELVVF